MMTGDHLGSLAAAESDWTVEVATLTRIIAASRIGFRIMFESCYIEGRTWNPVLNWKSVLKSCKKPSTINMGQ